MALVDDLPDGARVAFDTNSVIYYVEEHGRYLQVVIPVFDRVRTHNLDAHFSLITLTEVLVGPLHDGQATLAELYREILNDPNYNMHDIDRAIAERAALIRARFSLRTPDAIVAATAMEHRCSHLITNAPTFRRVEGLRVLVIDDYV